MTKPDIHDLIDKIAESYKDILGENLVGIYLHGSIAFGCFNRDKSDIDFIVTVRNPLTLNEKIKMIETLLTHDPTAPKKGFEMSVVLEKYCTDFVYPTPFELHFSNTHKQKCIDDTENYCKNMNGVDPDLAAHFTVIREVGLVVCGESVDKVFGDVPKKAYLDSIIADIENCVADITENPVYVILNLCRVASFLADGLVISKKDGGQWGIKYLPAQYSGIIQTALDCYCSGAHFQCDNACLRDFAEYMLKRINKHCIS